MFAFTLKQIIFSLKENFKNILSPELEIKLNFKRLGFGADSGGVGKDTQQVEGSRRFESRGRKRKKESRNMDDGGERSEPPKWDSRIVATVA